MIEFLKRLGRAHRSDGASAVEYGLLVAAIAGVIVIVMFAMGGTVQGLFKHTCDSVGANDSNASTAASCSS